MGPLMRACMTCRPRSLLARCRPARWGPTSSARRRPHAPGYGSAPHAGSKPPRRSEQAASPAIRRRHWTSRRSGGLLFQSPALDRLVEQALTANPDVGAAQAALRQAHELYSAQRTAYFPTCRAASRDALEVSDRYPDQPHRRRPSSIYTLYTRS